ncbi:uncharacterized protein TNCV_2834031 [Trichonephila clavipes]|nr:uncharacterized protein TNCV_2834031 [Trichonephila clavipes]
MYHAHRSVRDSGYSLINARLQTTARLFLHSSGHSLNYRQINYFPPSTALHMKRTSLRIFESFSPDPGQSSDQSLFSNPSMSGTFAELLCTVIILVKKLYKQSAVFEVDSYSEILRREMRNDEAHFWLNGYVNKQNCHIWSEANPQVYVETALNPENSLFGALYGLVESFFKNDEGHNVTVNGDQYRAMITNFFIPELNNHDVQELGFQQDDATCHTARATIDLLKDTFNDRIISRFGPVNCLQGLVI